MFCGLDVYSHRIARNTLLFLNRVIEEMPYQIQRIQTDRGAEFFVEPEQFGEPSCDGASWPRWCYEICRDLAH